METLEGQVEKKKSDVSCDGSAAVHHSPKKKRKRKHSGDGDHAKHHVHGGKHGHRPPHKRFKHSFGMSSTKLANNIMRFRLGGSVSDPLNLEGETLANLGDDCSTCAPSPAGGPEVFGQPSPLPFHLQHDPLNLEGKSKDFPANKTNKHVHHGLHQHNKHGRAGHKKKQGRRRTISKTEDHEKQEVGGACGEKTAATTHAEKPPLPTFNSKTAKFRYGNYDRYYGYRNSGAGGEDVRLSMLKREWFVGKDCLDIGSNTGQVTARIAQDFSPRRIVGIDIDPKLVKIAWKNLYRDYCPCLAPDGRPFPLSVTQTRGLMTIPLPAARTAASSACDVEGRTEEASSKPQENKFPGNVKFIHGNYLPSSDAALDDQLPEYDIILALSLTKWIHLNWGDDGIKRFFRKVFLHLHPGGKFIVEPQPYSSYAKKKKVSADIYENYQHIGFLPDQFHSFLMSPQVGFQKHKFIGIPQNKSKGFRRPLHMYIKAESVGEASHTHPVVGGDDSGESPLSEEALAPVAREEKLKSVVVVKERTDNEKNDEGSTEMETGEGGGGCGNIGEP